MMTHIDVRIPDGDKELVEKVCRARGEGVSSFVRRAVRRELGRLNFLTDEEKKALSIKR